MKTREKTQPDPRKPFQRDFMRYSPCFQVHEIIYGLMVIYNGVTLPVRWCKWQNVSFQGVVLLPFFIASGSTSINLLFHDMYFSGEENIIFLFLYIMMKFYSLLKYILCQCFFLAGFLNVFFVFGNFSPIC